VPDLVLSEYGDDHGLTTDDLAEALTVGFAEGNTANCRVEHP
jgi:hypothetical protein